MTFGTAGSHHVLATGLLGKSRGFSVSAFVIAQPWSAHAERVLGDSIACGIELIPARSAWTALNATALLFDSKTAIIPPGGSNLCGSMGYFEAAIELAQQVKSGDVPEPDYIVAAFGTAGTIAGLLAGVQYAGLKSIIVGVSVLRAAGRFLYAKRLANSILRSVGSGSTVEKDRLIIDSRWLGAGYGYATESGSAATSIAAALDLPLDPTYTAKAFAGALSLVKGRKISPNSNARTTNMAGAPLHVLYWHTLDASRADDQAAARAIVPQKLRALLRPCPAC
jgi:D-cysteine desulfhydrase